MRRVVGWFCFVLVRKDIYGKGGNCTRKYEIQKYDVRGKKKMYIGFYVVGY
jgi:hypothetical protein